MLDEILVLLIGVVPVGLVVLLTVQGLKIFGVVNDQNVRKAALAIALVFGLAALAGELYEPARVYIELGVQFFVGSMVAGLFYKAKQFIPDLLQAIIDSYNEAMGSSAELND